ncbi:MAG: helix-turn-helix domain-containing protein [Sphingomicrobium sp.]
MEYDPGDSPDPADGSSGPSLPIPFEPVPVRPRHDGWTFDRQVAIVEKLADCGSISAACKHVGMSRESVRQLRRRPGGRAFRDACDAALDCGYAEVEEAAMERARTGIARPVFYKGEQVGEWRHHDERLTMFMLRFRRRHRFGPEADSLPRDRLEQLGFPRQEDRPFDPESELDCSLDAMEFAPDAPPDDDLEFDSDAGEQ